MFKKLTLVSPQPEHIGKAFVRLGWIGFWMQLVIAVIPTAVLVYFLVFSASASNQQASLDLMDIIGLFGLAVLLFTMIWFYRYIRLGRSMADPERRPEKNAVIRSLWVGLAAGVFGVLFSMLLLISQVTRFLFIFASAPQGGLPVIQTTTYDPSSWVSAGDMAILLADLGVVCAELVVVGISLWLLFRMTAPSKAYDGQ